MRVLVQIGLLLILALQEGQPPTISVSRKAQTQVDSRGIALAPPIRCDERNNIFVRVYPSGAYGPMPITRISSDGKTVTNLDLSSVPDLPERSSIRDFVVNPDGEVFVLVQGVRANVIVEFRSNGQFVRKTTIEKIGVTKFAVFGNGDFLVLGIERPTNEKPHASQPFNALYSSGGKFLKSIRFEDDDKIQKQAETGDSDVSPNGPGTGNRAVSLGWATTAADGNVYAMRFVSPPIIYVVTPAGEVARRFTVGEGNQIPLGFQVAQGRLLMLLAIKDAQKLSAEAVIANTETGDVIAKYRVPEHFGAALACYDGTQALWLGGNIQGKMGILAAEMR